MAINQQLPFSRYLTKLVTKGLGSKEEELIIKVIDYLMSALEEGHSCVNLNSLSSITNLGEDELIKLLCRSQIATIYQLGQDSLPTTPLTIMGSQSNQQLLYITKYLYYELNVARKVCSLIKTSQLCQSESYLAALARLTEFSSSNCLPNEEQLKAIQVCANSKLSIITGGPGTGKTTTVTSLLWLLIHSYSEPLKIKVAAPTGKAAKRVVDSITESLANLGRMGLAVDNQTFSNLLSSQENFVTLHKLLGYIKNSIYFRHNQHNPLDVDVLIIDESSMIGLPLFSKLLDALETASLKHIIFLGDSQQLSSVEEGYVFASLVSAFRELNSSRQNYDLFNQPFPVLGELTISNRNQGDVSKLANAILLQNSDLFQAIISSSSEVRLETPEAKLIFQEALGQKNYGLAWYFNLIANNQIKDPHDLLALYNEQIILCLTNNGLMGIDSLNYLLEKKIRREFAISDEWYTGRPIMILENDYSLNLYNGDIGVAWCHAGKPVVVFEGGSKGESRQFIPEVLPKYRLAYAITIHKSQGSEYKHVKIVLPKTDNGNLGMLSRELLYTAVTRAKKTVTIFANNETIECALSNVTIRNSGLDLLLKYFYNLVNNP